jgi:hypothetical protein
MTLDEVVKSQYYTYVFEDDAWHVYIGREEAEDYTDFDD